MPLLTMYGNSFLKRCFLTARKYAQIVVSETTRAAHNLEPVMDKYFERIGLEWQYILWSKTYPYRYKAGRSTKFNARIRDIKTTMSNELGKDVHVRLFVKMPVLWAGANEKAIHGCILWRPAKNMPGSGYTEWSWSANVYCMILAWLACYAFGFHKGWSLLVLLLPLPLDFALLTFLLAIIQYFIVGLTFYGLWNIFF